MNTTIYPLAIRDMPPALEFVRMGHENPREGFHTGGPFMSSDGKEVWKPLDGRLFANADSHIPTRELDALALMANQPGFPANWRVEQTQHEIEGKTYTRRWLVRPNCIIAQPIESVHQVPILTLDQVLEVERGMREFNRRGWEINDPIVAGLDWGNKPFIVDLSAAAPIAPCWKPDENWRVRQWMQEVGFSRLALLRHLAEEMVSDVVFAQVWGYRFWCGHVYVIDDDQKWDKPDDVLRMRCSAEEAEKLAFLKGKDWVMTPDPLPQAVQDKNRTTWAWSPMRPPSECDPLLWQALQEGTVSNES
ncbi:MAG: hypothetical protein JW934_08060 [Anaerolineae bacterium]|nr:hypothetical protein [Anaerolineae bacterium]